MTEPSRTQRTEFQGWYLRSLLKELQAGNAVVLTPDRAALVEQELTSINRTCIEEPTK